MNDFGRTVRNLLCGLALAPLAALAQSDRASMVSAVSVAPASAALEATFAAAPAAAHWVVEGVHDSGTGAVVLLRASGTDLAASVDVAAQVAGRVAHAVGRSVEVVACSTGYALYLGGEAIAFVPNELGRALIHHRQVRR